MSASGLGSVNNIIFAVGLSGVSNENPIIAARGHTRERSKDLFLTTFKMMKKVKSLVSLDFAKDGAEKKVSSKSRKRGRGRTTAASVASRTTPASPSIFVPFEKLDHGSKKKVVLPKRSAVTSFSPASLPRTSALVKRTQDSTSTNAVSDRSASLAMPKRTSSISPATIKIDKSAALKRSTSRALPTLSSGATLSRLDTTPYIDVITDGWSDGDFAPRHASSFPTTVRSLPRKETYQTDRSLLLGHTAEDKRRAAYHMLDMSRRREEDRRRKSREIFSQVIPGEGPTCLLEKEILEGDFEVDELVNYELSARRSTNRCPSAFEREAEEKSKRKALKLLGNASAESLCLRGLKMKKTKSKPELKQSRRLSICDIGPVPLLRHDQVLTRSLRELKETRDFMSPSKIDDVCNDRGKLEPVWLPRNYSPAANSGMRKQDFADHSSSCEERAEKDDTAAQVLHEVKQSYSSASSTSTGASNNMALNEVALLALEANSRSTTPPLPEKSSRRRVANRHGIIGGVPQSFETGLHTATFHRPLSCSNGQCDDSKSYSKVHGSHFQLDGLAHQTRCASGESQTKTAGRQLFYRLKTPPTDSDLFRGSTARSWLDEEARAEGSDQIEHLRDDAYAVTSSSETERYTHGDFSKTSASRSNKQDQDTDTMRGDSSMAAFDFGLDSQQISSQSQIDMELDMLRHRRSRPGLSANYLLPSVEDATESSTLWTVTRISSGREDVEPASNGSKSGNNKCLFTSRPLSNPGWMAPLNPDDEHVYLVIGKDLTSDPLRVRLPVHLLVANSRYLAQIIEDARTASGVIDDPIHLPKIQPSIFEIFIQWIYHHNLNIQQPSTGRLPYIVRTPRLDELLDAWSLAHHLLSTTFKDTITTTIHRHLISLPPRDLPFKYIKRVGEMPTQDSALRDMFWAMMFEEKLPVEWRRDERVAVEMVGRTAWGSYLVERRRNGKVWDRRRKGLERGSWREVGRVLGV